MTAKTLSELQEVREHQTVAHLVNALATFCAASPLKVTDLLTGYLWDESEAASIRLQLGSGEQVEALSKHWLITFQSGSGYPLSNTVTSKNPGQWLADAHSATGAPGDTVLLGAIEISAEDYLRLQGML